MEIFQSHAIIRHLARVHDLYGSTEAEKIRCDVIEEALSGRLIFSVATAATTTLVLTGVTLHGLSVIQANVLVPCGFIALYVFGMFSANERLHQAIVLANATGIVVGYAPLIYTALGA